MSWIKAEIVIGSSKVHYWINSKINDVALVAVCGMLSNADDYKSAYDKTPIPAIIIESCFYDQHLDLTFNGQVERVSRLINSLHLKKCILIGHSVGGAVATMVATVNKTVQTLIIIDYIPVYPKADENWKTMAIKHHPKLTDVVNRFVRSNAKVDLRIEFSELTIPIHILKAEFSNYLTTESCDKLSTLNSGVVITEIKGCNHNLEGNLEHFKKIINHITQIA